LVLHVNRARWLLHGAKEKLQNHVSFPLRNFDMEPYCSSALLEEGESTTYNLCAVVNHHGRGIDMGHYTVSGVAHGTLHVTDVRAEGDRACTGV
jgi:uncharacterized UBP type Zn finger protein